MRPIGRERGDGTVLRGRSLISTIVLVYSCDFGLRIFLVKSHLDQKLLSEHTDTHTGPIVFYLDH